jgi:hypothetical protein
MLVGGKRATVCAAVAAVVLAAVLLAACHGDGRLPDKDDIRQSTTTTTQPVP